MPTIRRESSPRAIDEIAINAVLIAVRQAANVICDRWSLITLLHAQAGVHRFVDFRERCGMANRQLTKRLTVLEEREIMVRLPYTRRPLRYGYHLTHMGLALFDFFAVMVRWEHAWHPSSRESAPVSLEHSACSARHVDPVLCCAKCMAPLTARSVGRLEISQRELERMPTKETGYRRSGSNAKNVGPSPSSAPLEHCIEIFGDKWGIEIIVAAFLRVTTFGGFQRHTGISTNILSDRLARLVTLGILRQTTADEPGRTGTYELSDKGIDLYPILLAIQAWADDWLRDRYRSPVRLRHRPCGAAIQLRLSCNHCRQAMQRADSHFVLLALPTP